VEMLRSYLEAYPVCNCTGCAEKVFGISERYIWLSRNIMLVSLIRGAWGSVVVKRY
jgi:hypothetical protein